MSPDHSLALILAIISAGLFIAAFVFGRSQKQYSKIKADEHYRQAHRRTREIEQHHRRPAAKPDPVSNDTNPNWNHSNRDWSDWYKQ